MHRKFQVLEETKKKMGRESRVTQQEARTQIADMAEESSGIGIAKH